MLSTGPPLALVLPRQSGPGQSGPELKMALVINIFKNQKSENKSTPNEKQKQHKLHIQHDEMRVLSYGVLSI